ncbi:Arylsulfatase [Limihaloglobus sulfuriphilus]|uniref:Arylsulfatase n=1 Tax=Limihaloglobus sulfuriphilus TaxID=1851148 RepID=A0A1Q2MBJ4_9BACT|nr:sulfatase-like hydrolase/transferase [Limihaloglobus sulfuriphilus]AQQ70051.1 Arylsulfatase [Limihaloglobus sulfuriphilus]
MKRRDFLKLSAVSVFSSFAGCLKNNNMFHAASSPAAKRPNIVFFFCDDMGWGDLGCYGNDRIKTPNIDKFAKEGTLLTNFYVNSPVCSPTRASVMTGRFPAELRFFYALAAVEQNKERGMPNYLDPELPMLPRLLKTAGYTTGHFGKWHMGGPQDKTAPPPAEYGIDQSATFLSNGPGCYPPNSPQHESSKHIVNHAIKFIEQNGNKPFFANVSLSEPHSILVPSDEQMEPYKKWGPTKGGYRGAMQVYYAVISNIDREFGRLMDKLDELAIRDNTLVVFSSDNGPSPIWGWDTSHSGAGSTGPFRGCKASLYEGGIRAPFITRWPKVIPENKVDNELVLSTADLLPTFCAAADAKLPAEMKISGENMLDSLAGSRRQRSKPILWEYRYLAWGRHIQKSPALAIREGKWKLLMNPDGSRVELYDLKENPSETDNKASEQPIVVKKLRKKLLAWHKTIPLSDELPDAAGSFHYPWPK